MTQKFQRYILFTCSYHIKPIACKTGTQIPSWLNLENRDVVLYFTFLHVLDIPQNLSQLEKEVGSVRKETDLSFKFKIKDTEKPAPESVPFQVLLYNL